MKMLNKTMKLVATNDKLDDSSHQTKKILIVVDSGIDNYLFLAKGVIPEAEVIILDTSRDGIQQITEALKDFTDIESLHLVCHGSSASLQLGKIHLDSNTLAQYAGDLISWSKSLSQKADILLYGCNVAAGENGQNFVDQLSELTGANIAASTNQTGSDALGGDWNFEYTKGKVKATVAFTPETIYGYQGILSASNLLDSNLNLDDNGNSIAIQLDGKIIVAGISYDNGKSNFAIARYNSDETIDNSFGTNGKVTTDFGANEESNSIAIQLDGKIVVAGTSYEDKKSDFAVARYNVDGSLDTSFGTGGKVTTDFGAYEYGNSIAIQPNGQMIVAGISHNNFAVAKYNVDGSLDTSFGTDGKVTTDFGAYEYGNSIAIQPNGQMIVAGYSYDNNDKSNFAIARYNNDGSLDTSFGTGGKVTTEFDATNEGVGGNFNFDQDGKVVNGFVTNENGSSITVQSDGKIVVAGKSENSFAVARYNSDGSLDTSFHNDGKNTTDFAKYPDGSSVNIQSDGKLAVAGTAYDQGYGIFTVTPKTKDNHAPQALYLSSNQVDENQPSNTVIGTLSTEDLDLDDLFTYSLVSGVGDTHNSFFKVVGDQLLTNQVFDYETTNIYNIRLRTTDNSGDFYEEQLIVNVKDGIDQIIGDASNNVLMGTPGKDSLEGLDGDDSIYALGDDDTLNGGTGKDRLVGGGGSDSMVGGTGNDTYVIDYAGDTISETSNFSAEIDTVEVYINYTLDNNLEELKLKGASPLDGYGNSLDNILKGNLESNTLHGNEGNDSLYGAYGEDSLYGDNGNDSLDGGEHRDRLDGGTGDDTMSGGRGNDTYIVDSVGDKINETSTLQAETDFVEAYVSYSLDKNLERLTLKDFSRINAVGNNLNNNLTGNGGSNLLDGNAGNDSLIGGAGNDSLTGGIGNDSFVFNSPSEGVDLISDFSAVDDSIVILATAFGGGLTAATTLSSSQFVLGKNATDSNDRFIYDSSNGALYFDTDGTGSSGKLQIATLNGQPIISNSDILLA